MYNIIKTTVTISMIQKNTVHNVICTQQIIIIIKKKEIMQARPHLSNRYSVN